MQCTVAKLHVSPAQDAGELSHRNPTVRRAGPFEAQGQRELQEPALTASGTFRRMGCLEIRNSKKGNARRSMCRRAGAIYGVDFPLTAS